MNKIFNHPKKSQAALEFLMTYGWAILVVLVAIGALAYFGVLSPDKFLPSKCTLPSGIACLDFKVDYITGTPAKTDVTLVLMNSLGWDIKTMVVSVAGGTGTESCGADAPITGTPPPPTALSNGEKATFTITCQNIIPVGKKFSGTVGVKYENADSGLAHVVNGTITSRVE